MKLHHTILVARILLGLAFIIFGLNFWLKFMPTPPPPSELADQFIGALFVSGFLAAVKVIEILGGLALLSGRFAPLGLTLIGGTLAVITGYDIFLAGKLNPMVLALDALALFLLFAYRKNFHSLLQAPKV